MELIRAEGSDELDEVDVRMKVIELLSIERAMRQYKDTVVKARRQPFREDDDVRDGILEIFNELELSSLDSWP